MGFIMHGWKKSESTTCMSLVFFLLVAYLLVQPLPGFAETQGINIRNVDGTMLENTYMINADVDYHFSPETQKALIHGVPLQFDTRITVKKQRSWIWDKTLNAVVFKYKVQYHPLSGYYLVTNMQNGEHQQFKNLPGVVDSLGKLKNYPLISRNALDADTGEYYGQISVKLDIQSLPAPLRPLAYISTQWHLSSPTYAWSIRP